jgi:methyl-accepting chemotaxis protein
MFVSGTLSCKIRNDCGVFRLEKERRLPKRKVRVQTRIVESTAKEVEQILAGHNGLTNEARAAIRQVFERNLGDLEYFVLVREDSFGEIHTNRLREGIYFQDPIGLKCAAVTSTTAFLYPRNTGEMLIDVSVPVYLNGKKVFALRSGMVLLGTGIAVKKLLPVTVLLVGVWSAAWITQPFTRITFEGILSVLLLGFAVLDLSKFQNAYKTWIQYMREIGKGHLQNRLQPKTRDEYGQMQFELNKVAIGISDILKQIATESQQVAASAQQLMVSADEVSRASEEISNTIQEIATGSEMQAQETDQVGQAMQNMAVALNDNAALAIRVSQSASEASQIAASGRQTVDTTIQQMNQIQESVHQLEQTMTQLQTHMQDIARFTQVITAISSQTNMLALNAAIEAARAGEHGRGFVVVAEEVRKLADQSKDAAAKIATLVGSIQSEMEKADTIMNMTVQEVQTGIETVQSAGHSFGDIDTAVQKLAEQTQSVFASLHQIVSESEQIVEMMKEVAKVAVANTSGTQTVSAATEEQLASIEEISRSIGTLSHMADDLQTLVNRFDFSHTP